MLIYNSKTWIPVDPDTLKQELGEDIVFSVSGEVFTKAGKPVPGYHASQVVPPQTALALLTAFNSSIAQVSDQMGRLSSAFDKLREGVLGRASGDKAMHDRVGGLQAGVEALQAAITKVNEAVHPAIQASMDALRKEFVAERDPLLRGLEAVDSRIQQIEEWRRTMESAVSDEPVDIRFRILHGESGPSGVDAFPKATPWHAHTWKVTDFLRTSVDSLLATLEERFAYVPGEADSMRIRETRAAIRKAQKISRAQVPMQTMKEVSEDVLLGMLGVEVTYYEDRASIKVNDGRMYTVSRSDMERWETEPQVAGAVAFAVKSLLGLPPDSGPAVIALLHRISKRTLAEPKTMRRE